MPKYSDEALRGMLLEEAILFILSKTGYNPILSKDNDPSLCEGSSGLEVYGRGSKHQIDAISDFLYTPPFCNPQRLLIEAKFKNSKTGIDIVRNATGVHKDVSEHWISESTNENKIPRKRFQYLYAIFSKEAFTKPAQDYAYAQGIFLLPLKNNSLFQPIIDKISDVSLEHSDSKPRLCVVRAYIRSKFFPSSSYNFHDKNFETTEINWIRSQRREPSNEFRSFIETCRERGFGFVTMFDGKFPVFLSASRELKQIPLANENTVRIRVSNNKWRLENSDGELLFSFDLPEELFELYQNSGVLSQRRLLNIKRNHMSEFHVFMPEENRLVLFKLDQEWFNTVSSEINSRPR